MVKFCSKCGKELKNEGKFCAFCGTVVKKTSLAQGHVTNTPPPPSPAPPTSKSSSGCGKGCLVGCLISLAVFILITGLILLGGYLFLRNMKDGEEPGEYFSVERSLNPKECEDSLSCIEESFKICSPATGTTDLEDLAVLYFEVIGPKEDSCVVYFKVIEVKESSEEGKLVPKFALDAMLKDLSMECLVPSSVYEEGIDGFMEYINENMAEACRGPLLDMINKFGVELK